jgi:hypothetical protein
MFRAIRKFDYFKAPITLRFNGDESHYTFLGVVFTLIAFGVLIFVSYFFG